MSDLASARREFEEIFDNVGSELIALWPTLDLRVRVSMVLAAMDGLDMDEDCRNSLIVAVPELTMTPPENDDSDECAAPPLALVEANDEQRSTLAIVLQALRSGTEYSEEIWPPALDFESTVAAEIGARGAAVAFENLKRARSNVLVQVATNLLLIQIQDSDNDGEEVENNGAR
jgi:hypothetical protein